MIPALLREAYAEPQRRYHTWDHIQACLEALGKVGGLSEANRRTAELALLWHDAVYDPTRHDNEALSADWAERELAAQGEAPDVIAEISRLIRLTQGHTVEPGDSLGALVVSIDLGILGAPPAAYDRYAAEIREEYGHVPEALYRPGRATLLKRFLASPAIFPDPAFHARFDGQARANLAREISALEA